MPVPPFPRLNGQVKVPLRFYTDERLVSINAKPCMDLFKPCVEGFSACPFAIITPKEAMPPFQFWKPSSTSPIETWRVYNLGGGNVANLDADIPLIQQDAILDLDYWTYFGDALSTEFSAEEPLFCKIRFEDGTTFYSEIFRPTCESQHTTGQTVFGWNFDNVDGLQGWSVVDEDHRADLTWNIAGDPSVAEPFAGMIVINLADELVYTYNGTTWSSAAASNNDYRLDSATGVWYRFSGGVWDVFDASPIQPGDNGACYQGIQLNTANQDLSIDDVAWGSETLRVEVVLSSSFSGYMDITIGGVMTHITTGGTHVFDILPVSGEEILLEPSSNFDGCIVSIDVSERDEFGLDCNLLLEWTNCGNVGGLYYENGFVNKLYLHGDVEVTRPTINTNIEATENGSKRQIPDFFRKEVEYSLPIGQVPWHIVDALSEIPGHATVRLTQKYGQGTDLLYNIRVEQRWPETNQDCLSTLTLFFQIDEATTSTECCAEAEKPCVDSIGSSAITSIECFEEDCDLGYVVQATILEGYRGLLQYSEDGGATWVNTDLDLFWDEWPSNEVPVEVPAFFFRIQVYSGDCIAGVTASDAPCADGRVYVYDVRTAQGDPGNGVFLFNSLIAGSITKVFIDDRDAFLADQQLWANNASGQVFFTFLGTPSNVVVLNITSVTDDAGFVIWNVTYVSGTIPSDDQAFCVSYGHEE